MQRKIQVWNYINLNQIKALICFFLPLHFFAIININEILPEIGLIHLCQVFEK